MPSMPFDEWMDACGHLALLQVLVARESSPVIQAGLARAQNLLENGEVVPAGILLDALCGGLENAGLKAAFAAVAADLQLYDAVEHPVALPDGNARSVRYTMGGSSSRAK